MRILHRISRARVIASRALASAALVAGAYACTDITSLEQEAPSRVISRDLFIPGNAQLLVISAISDYECALAQTIIAGGLVGDELIDAQLSQQGWDYDRRTIIPALTAYASAQCGATQVPGVYTPLNVARKQADDITTALEGWSDTEVANRTDLIGQAAAHAGYSLLLLGEVMCSAAIDLGPELTRAQIFAEAENRFNKAIAAATTANNAAILNMSYVGRARARLNLGNAAGARADAALVPAAFVRNATYSAANTRRENLVWSQMHRGLFTSVDPSFRGLTVGGVADSRVVVVDAGVNGHDVQTRIWRQMKFPAVGTPIPIASYDEAQLIIAEIDAATGTPAGILSAETIINGLRSRASLPPYVAGTPAQVQADVREERRRELFLEGQRLNDIIRFNITLTPAAGTSFPVKGGVYGSDVGSQLCFPLPDLERNNNPNL
jgi:starch-binding outer membrane protein, SusD/RagB family